MAWDEIVKIALKRGWTSLEGVAIYKHKIGIGRDGSLYAVNDKTAKMYAITPPTLTADDMVSIIMMF